MSFPIPACCTGPTPEDADLVYTLGNLRAFSVVLEASPPPSPLDFSAANEVNFDEWVDLEGLVADENNGGSGGGGEDDGEMMEESAREEEEVETKGHAERDEEDVVETTKDAREEEEKDVDMDEEADGEQTNDTTGPCTPPDKIIPAADVSCSSPPCLPSSPSPTGAHEDRLTQLFDHYDVLAHQDAAIPLYVDPKAVLLVYRDPSYYVSNESQVDRLPRQGAQRERQIKRRRLMPMPTTPSTTRAAPFPEPWAVVRQGMDMSIVPGMETGSVRSHEQQQEWLERQRQQEHLRAIQRRMNEAEFRGMVRRQREEEEKRQQQENERRQQLQTPRARTLHHHRRHHSDQPWTTPHCRLQLQQTTEKENENDNVNAKQQEQQQQPPHHHRRTRSDQQWATPRQQSHAQLLCHRSQNQEIQQMTTMPKTPHPTHHRRQRSDQQWATPRQQPACNGAANEDGNNKDGEDDDDDEEEGGGGKGEMEMRREMMQMSMQRQKAAASASATQQQRPVLVYERSTAMLSWWKRGRVAATVPNIMHVIPIANPFPYSNNPTHPLTPLFAPGHIITTLLTYIPLTPRHTHTYIGTHGFRRCERCTAAGRREARRVAAMVRDSGVVLERDLAWVSKGMAREGVRELWCLEPSVEELESDEGHDGERKGLEEEDE